MVSFPNVIILSSGNTNVCQQILWSGSFITLFMFSVIRFTVIKSKNRSLKFVFTQSITQHRQQLSVSLQYYRSDELESDVKRLVSPLRNAVSCLVLYIYTTNPWKLQIIIFLNQSNIKRSSIIFIPKSL